MGVNKINKPNIGITKRTPKNLPHYSLDFQILHEKNMKWSRSQSEEGIHSVTTTDPWIYFVVGYMTMNNF
jgi:hypothetical protein